MTINFSMSDVCMTGSTSVRLENPAFYLLSLVPSTDSWWALSLDLSELSTALLINKIFTWMYVFSYCLIGSCTAPDLIFLLLRRISGKLSHKKPKTWHHLHWISIRTVRVRLNAHPSFSSHPNSQQSFVSLSGKVFGHSRWPLSIYQSGGPCWCVRNNEGPMIKEDHGNSGGKPPDFQGHCIPNYHMKIHPGFISICGRNTKVWINRSFTGLQVWKPLTGFDWSTSSIFIWILVRGNLKVK